MKFSTLIEWIKNWLLAPRKDQPESILYSELEHIDPNKIAKKFLLREEAARLGAGGIPPANAIGLSGPESEAVNEIELARRGYQTWATRRLASIDSDIARNDIRHEINLALSEEVTFKNKVASFLTSNNEKLGRLGETVAERKNELDRFKNQNNLNRLANRPTKSKVFLSYATLLLLTIIEGIANGTFFQRGLEGGLQEGIIDAIFFATANVLVAFFIGKYIFRNVFHLHLMRKAIGFFSGLVAIFFSISIGLMLGHFRTALNSQAESAKEIAWQAFINTPFLIGGMDSTVLFFVTIIFATIAFLDGLFLDDLYPGYGAINDKYLESLEDYDADLEVVHEELYSYRTDCVKHLDKTIASCQGNMASLQAQIIEKRAAGERLDAAMRAAQAAANASVQIFRTENQLSRGTIEYPKYFESEPVLLELQLPDFDTTKDEFVAKEQAILINKLVNEAPEIRRKIEAAFSDKYDSLNTLEQHFKNRPQL
jgi:hypothetical protein